MPWIQEAKTYRVLPDRPHSGGKTVVALAPRGRVANASAGRRDFVRAAQHGI